jgi:hypothetical protein
MVWPRYVLYFVGILLVFWVLTRLEIQYPGSLQLYVPLGDPELPGTSEFSPVEIVQPLILAVCGALMGWVAWYCPTQRPIAVPFGGVALVFLIRECGYFIDRYLIGNLWPILIAITLAFMIAYTFRAARRLRIALARIWPSPALALAFAGAVVLVGFVRLVGSGPLWMAILGNDYRPIVDTAVEEFVELLGYLLWLVAAIEYAYQARAISYREPQPAARRRRQKRRHDREGKF